MSNCLNTSLSCGRTCGWYGSIQQPCGTVCSTAVPSCNPWAPWNSNGNWHNPSCYSWNGCSSLCSAACSGCSHADGCTCSTCNGCDTCGGCSSCACGSSGYLVSRAVSIGRTFQRRITQTLCVEDLPDIAQPPFTLVSVAVSGQAMWEQLAECQQRLLRVTVPVVVQVRDCNGRCRTGHSTVTLTIPLCACSAQDWQGQLYVAPCIRLAAPVTECEDACFEATLEVKAEVYRLHMQVVNS